MTEGRKLLIANLVRDESPENAKSIELIANEIFKALDGINRVADALEKLVTFKGIS